MRAQVEPHPVEHAGREILHEHIADFDERVKDLHPLRVLGIERYRALIVVQHREIEAVHIRNIAELATRDVAGARPLHLDYIGPEPRQELRAGRPRLHMRKVEDSHPIQCFRHFFFPRLQPRPAGEKRMLALSPQSPWYYLYRV